jgi:hypothetical protein
MANGTIAFDTLQTSGQITGTAKSVDTDYVVNGSAKAWVNFDGTASGAAARDSFNVSGMTDNSTGNYTVTYSANFNNTNNSPVTGAGGSGYTDRLLTIDSITTSTVTLVENTIDSTQDVAICTVHTMGDVA